MGGQWKPFDTKSNTGLYLKWTAWKLWEGCYWRHMPQS